MSDTAPGQTYQPYRNLPPVAGICSMSEAMSDGILVDECVRRLKRFHYAFKRLHEILTKRITAEPIYELKMAFSYHSYLCAEHVAALRKRVGEMREPPLGLEKVPDPYLKIFFDEILAAPTTAELVVGIYSKAIPVLQAGLERHIADTNVFVDQPSVRVCRFALLELGEMTSFGQESIACLVDQETAEKMKPWLALLDDCLSASGKLDGVDPLIEKEITRQHSHTPYEYDSIPRRDERFIDLYNMGVHAEAFIYDEKYPPQPKTLMLHFKRIREIDVPEMMASIIAETEGKPWDYYLDMSRQLWDEARHAIMGEVGFVSVGIDWRKIPIHFTWSLELNRQLAPLERHAVLYFVEQGLMAKTGKRFELEVAHESGSRLSALFQDYDWADEVLHAQIGRRWYVSEIGDLIEASDYGDACWSRVLVDWRQYMEDGLTEHSNWWPEIYTDACQIWGIEPDPEILAFSETYEELRDDLKVVSTSA